MTPIVIRATSNNHVLLFFLCILTYIQLNIFLNSNDLVFFVFFYSVVVSVFTRLMGIGDVMPCSATFSW